MFRRQILSRIELRVETICMRNQDTVLQRFFNHQNIFILNDASLNRKEKTMGYFVH